MTLEEFVRLDPSQIRRSERLMQLFVDFYEAAFSFKPKCAGCSFKKGFKKLQAYTTKGSKKIIKFDNMDLKTFQLKKSYRSKILTYKKDGVTYRKYGNKLTEDFAIALVADGQEHLFDKLPKVKRGKVDVKELEVNVEKDYSSLNYRKELIPLYDEVSQKTGKESKSRKKEDIIAFLKENED